MGTRVKLCESFSTSLSIIHMMKLADNRDIFFMYPLLFPTFTHRILARLGEVIIVCGKIEEIIGAYTYIRI